jgi:glucose/arabinose dehydrogenase
MISKNNMMIRRTLPLLLLLPVCLAAQPKIQLTPFATGFTRPVDIVHAGDSRLFVVEQNGFIWVLDSTGARLPGGPFLDIDARVRSTGNEQGLLGLAFHPNYATNGYFYVNYTRNGDGDTRISRFSRDATNPNKANPDSELIIMEIDQPFNNHNGGCIKFGPDGYLYIGMGDGGNAGDPSNYAQTKNTRLGKFLRIDIDVDFGLYAVPPDNPFLNDPAYLPEIWSVGWRNPWRFSFDRLTGDLWAGDVGQTTREEVDFEPAGVGGRNYGWRCYEGFTTYNTSGCLPANNFTGPFFDYDNASVGCSVTGGFVYRGSLHPDLYGMYLFADYCSGRWWGTRFNPQDSTFDTQLIADLTDFQFVSYGEDFKGELYVAELTAGRIMKIEERCSGFQLNGTVEGGPVCAGSQNGAIALDISGGATPVAYAWADGPTTKDRSGLAPGMYTVTATDNIGCVRILRFDIEPAGLPVPQLLSDRPFVCSFETIMLRAENLVPPVTLYWEKDGQPLAVTTTTDSVYAFSSTAGAGVYTVRMYDPVCLDTLTADYTVQADTSVDVAIGLRGTDTLYIASPLPGMFQWNLNGQAIPGATNATHVVLENGLYNAVWTTPNGCTVASEGILVELLGSALPTSVRAFRVSPNPTDSRALFFLELDAPHRIQVSLFDTAGRSIFSQTRQGTVFQFPLELEALSPGVYHLVVQMDGAQWSRKVIRR